MVCVVLCGDVLCASLVAVLPSKFQCDDCGKPLDDGKFCAKTGKKHSRPPPPPPVVVHIMRQRLVSCRGVMYCVLCCAVSCAYCLLWVVMVVVIGRACGLYDASYHW